MIRPLAGVVILFCAAHSFCNVDTLNVNLRFNYHAEDPHWARFGAIDSRQFNLRVAPSTIPRDCIIGTDAETRVVVHFEDAIQEYFGTAAQKTLAGCGALVNASSAFRLRLTPEKLSVASFDGMKDGLKICTVALRAEMRGPGTTVLFLAETENQGMLEFSDGNSDKYEELVNMTMHGAVIKLWASRVLFTDTALGKGRIIKKDLGTYGFVPQALFATADSLSAAGNLKDNDTWLPAHASMKTPALSDNAISIGEEPHAALPISGNYAESGSTVALHGKKITIGILPFENATGKKDITGPVADMQQAILLMYSQSKTVKVLEREKLSDILKEQALGMSGIMNDSTVVKVGNLSGLKAMIVGRVTTAGSYFRITARVINVETSAVVAIASAHASDANTIGDAVPELASSLLAAFTGEKLGVNRNTMSYPSVSPMAIPAVAASIEDAWAVEINPACLSKVKQRDVNFFFSLATRLAGSTGGNHVETYQPPFENLGVNAAIPIGTSWASGFGIRHSYSYPRLEAQSLGYDVKEEETILTMPVSLGITPAFSIGANARLHLLEYQITNPAHAFLEGNAVFADAKIGALFKVSQRFKAGLTIRPQSFYMVAQERDSSQGGFVRVKRETPGDFRFGIAMYPLKWFFFFGDLQYEKFPGYPQIQPGFHLGWQLTHYGRLLGLPFMPVYSMVPLYIGYSHEPYNRVFGTQAKYFSLGTGYYLNNIYIQWALRFNVEEEKNRRIVLGSTNDNVTVSDYSLSTPLFFCIGYRF
jgi:TolB-like protein